MNQSPPASPGVCDINQGIGLNVSTIVLVALTAIIVAMRFAVRILVVKEIGWDDWTILLALIGTLIGSALDFVEVHYGFGRHYACLSEWQQQEFGKYVYGEWIQTFASLMWTKVSICLFLLRIPIRKVFIRPLQASVVILILSNIILTLLWILQCRPVHAAWNKNVHGQCFSRGQLQRVIMAQAIISLVSDFAFASFPILLLWKVQIKLRRKIALCFLMGFGVITGACCLVRTVINFQAIALDASYGGIDNWFWRLFEVQFGIMAACFPTFPPGYKWLRRRWNSRNNSSIGHVPLADNPAFAPARDTTITKPSQAYRTDLSFSNSLLSETQPGNTATNQIRKTVSIDVERNAREDYTNHDDSREYLPKNDHTWLDVV